MFARDSKTAQMGTEILPFEMGYLPDFYQRKAEIELNDTPENRNIGLKNLRELVRNNDKFFRGLDADDDFLLQYLRCRKFNVKKAYKQIKFALNFQRTYSAIFKDIYFENIAITTKNKIVTFLPYRCQDGCAILFVKLDNWMPEEFPVEEVRRMVMVIFLQALRDPMTQVNGFKVIFDVESNPMRHIKYVTPSNMYQLYYGTQQCVPGRFKGIHIVNNTFVLKAAWTILQLFLSDKVKKRFHFHNTPEGLSEYFPAAVLPVEYGGELKNYDMTGWLKDVMSPEKLATLAGGTCSAL